MKNGDVDKNLSQSLNVRASLPLYSNNSFVNVTQTHLVKEQPKIDFGYSPTSNNVRYYFVFFFLTDVICASYMPYPKLVYSLS